MSAVDDWAAAHRPSMEQLHNAGHHVLAYHRWDGPDHFALHGEAIIDGDDLEPLLLSIMEIEDPDLFPVALDDIMERAVNEPFPVPIVAVTLQIEAYTIITDRHGNLTDDQKWAIEQRQVYRRADAHEVARVVTVGVGGDIHIMERFRDTGETVHVAPTLSTDIVGANCHGAVFQRKLCDIAQTLPYLYVGDQSAAVTREEGR